MKDNCLRMYFIPAKDQSCIVIKAPRRLYPVDSSHTFLFAKRIQYSGRFEREE